MKIDEEVPIPLTPAESTVADFLEFDEEGGELRLHGDDEYFTLASNEEMSMRDLRYFAHTVRLILEVMVDVGADRKLAAIAKDNEKAN
jgi:hypothetical protein